MTRCPKLDPLGQDSKLIGAKDHRAAHGLSVVEALCLETQGRRFSNGCEDDPQVLLMVLQVRALSNHKEGMDALSHSQWKEQEPFEHGCFSLGEVGSKLLERVSLPHNARGSTLSNRLDVDIRHPQAVGSGVVETLGGPRNVDIVIVVGEQDCPLFYVKRINKQCEEMARNLNAVGKIGQFMEKVTDG